MNIYIYLCIMCFALGCQPGNTSKSFSSKVDTAVAQHSNSGLPDEDFASYLKKISLDSAYQRSRIKFPILVKTQSEYGVEVSLRNVTDWEYMNFEDIDELSREVLITNDSVRQVRFYDPEVAFEVIYIFHKLDGQWFFTEIEDNSN